MSTLPKQNDSHKNNMSSRMIQAQMARSRKSITYNTSIDNTIIQKILQKNESTNKSLLLYLHYRRYESYLNRILNSASYNDEEKGELTAMYENIKSNLTIDELKRAELYIEPETEKQQNIQIFENELKRNPDFIYNCKIITIGVFNNFVITNYRNGDLFTPGKKYLFDLQDSSNYGYVLSFSREKYDYREIDGLYLIGTPGTIGSYLVFQPDLNINFYEAFAFNKLDNTIDSYDRFAYVFSSIIIEANYKSRGIVDSYNKYNSTDLQCLLPESKIKPVEKRGPKYVFESSTFAFTDLFLDRYSVNRRYGLYYGLYKTNINSNTNPMTILNKGKEHLIQFRGDEDKKSVVYLSNLDENNSLDGSYNFYYGDVEIEILGDFGECSLYSFFYGYNFMENLLMFSKDCAGSSTYRTDFEDISSGSIKCLYPHTVVNFVEIADQPFITFNNNISAQSYDSGIVYGMYIGQYIFKDVPESNPIGFINHGKKEYFHYFGDSKKMKKRYGPDNKVYEFYYDTIIVQIYGDFGKMSVYDFYNGYCGGKYLLQYTDVCEYDSDWVPEKDILTTPNDQDNPEFDTDGASFDISGLDHYSEFNIVNYNGVNNILLGHTDVSFIENGSKNGVNSGNYVLLNIPQNTPIALLNKGVEDLITYDGYFPYKITSLGPDGFYYDFYYGNINIYVTGDFGRISIYTLNDGFLNGRHSIIYDVNVQYGLAITNYGSISYSPLTSTNLVSDEPKTFVIFIDVIIVRLPYSNNYTSYKFSGYDRNGKINSDENNPSLTFYIGDFVHFLFNYTNNNFTFGIYEIKTLLEDPQLITNNNNTNKSKIEWIPNKIISNYYYYRSSNNSDLMYNTINILPNDSAIIDPSLVSIDYSNNDIISSNLASITLTFDSIININSSKNIYFFNDDTNINDYVLNSNHFSGIGTKVLTLNTGFNNYNRLKFNTNYKLICDDGLFLNIYNKSISNNTLISLTTEVKHDPTLLSITPTSYDVYSNDISINIFDPITLSFSEPVEVIDPSKNKITFENIDNNIEYEYIRVDTSGNDLLIYADGIDYEETYKINIEESTIVDLSNIEYEFNDTLLTNYIFRTIVDPRPIITSFDPSNNATDAFIDTYIYLTFDKPVFVNNIGNILIKDLDSNLIFDAILLDNSGDASQVYGSGMSTIVITPYDNFLANNNYTISIQNGCFYDGSNNLFAGLAESVYTFTTGSTTNPDVVDLSQYEISDNDTSG